MGNSPKCHLHAMNYFSIVIASVFALNIAWCHRVICLLKKRRKTLSKGSRERISDHLSTHRDTKNSLWKE